MLSIFDVAATIVESLMNCSFAVTSTQSDDHTSLGSSPSFEMYATFSP